MSSTGAALGQAFHDLAASAAGFDISVIQFPHVVAAMAFGAALPVAAGGEWSSLETMIAGAFTRAPALVLGLGVLLAIPPLALTGAFLRRRTRRRDASPDETYLVTRSRTRTGDTAGQMGPGAQDLERGRPVSGRRAFVEIEGSEPPQRIPLAREVIRIGREPDNDIVLTDMTVHRYHAVIHRGDEAEFMVTDLSSMDGNGVAVGGARVNRAPLREGDVIALGNTRLKFIAGQS